MDRDQIKVLLHHREPYLMVDRVDKLTESSICGVKLHRGDESYLEGHFPGAPVVPGAMLQELCTQSASVLLTRFYSGVINYDSERTQGHAIGVLSKVGHAKYYSLVKPEGELFAQVDLIEHIGNLFKFRARVEHEGQLKAKLQFSLMNLSDTHLL
ncbi:MAG: 3-hydroxyacyl-ACP dehydratase FabZ family protein [Coraliomargaritaceae bacterium]